MMEKKIKDLIKKEIKKLEVQIEEAHHEYRETTVLEYWKKGLENFQTLSSLKDMKSWVETSKKEVKRGMQRVEDNHSPFYFGEEFDDEYDEMYFADSMIGLDNAVDTVLRTCGEAYLLQNG